MAEKKASRIITENVADFEELVSVKRSIYSWDKLKSGDGNFFVECDDLEHARKSKGAIKSSGTNYYLKRRTGLLPVVIIAKLKNGKIGVLCSAIAAE